MRRAMWTGALLLSGFLLGGCPPKPPTGELPPATKVSAATATLEAKSGSKITGTASFEEIEGGKVKVVIDVQNALPGEHGLHIHEKGDCSDPEAKNAGAHFNPGKHDHAGPPSPVRHAGDLGNISIGPDGTGRIETVTDMFILSSGPTSVTGRAVVIHEKPDDLTTQPSGNSGNRIGCGVIKPNAQQPTAAP